MITREMLLERAKRYEIAAGNARDEALLAHGRAVRLVEYLEGYDPLDRCPLPRQCELGATAERSRAVLDALIMIASEN